ncbi:MAG TPA: O-antigen ligase family protein [Oculatellaceae cyanobacterium]|jgi:O-antigen ligase
MQAIPTQSTKKLAFTVSVLLAFLLPLFGLIILPAIGVQTLSGPLSSLFQYKTLMMLFGGLIGGVAYLQYFRFVQARPQILVAFIALAWPLVAYLNSQLLSVGVNLHLRPLLVVSLAFPCLWVSLKYRHLIRQHMSWSLFYLLFFGWLLLYAMFFNPDAEAFAKSGDEDGSIGIMQLFAYFYCLLAMWVAGITTLKARHPQGLFDTFNKALIIISGLEALVTILGFPFGLTSMPIDGFTRAVGIFGHPNMYAHHMGILMLYLLGLFCYYQGKRANRLPGWLLFGGIAINGVAFLLGLSKTALGVYTICAVLLLLLNLSVPEVRRGFLKIAMASVVLIPLGLFGFQALTGESFLSVLESRMEQTQSMNWRATVWQELLASISTTSILFGHGYTAANELLFRVSYSDSENAKPLILVHNAYLALIYDLGIVGYSMFACTLALCWQSIRHSFHRLISGLRVEHTIILTLSLYFLIACGFDEMSYMFDAPMLYWLLCAILYCLALRETHQEAVQ